MSHVQLNASNKSTLHVLKTVNPYFTDVWERRKNFEYRYNGDRVFSDRDWLLLVELHCFGTDHYDKNFPIWSRMILINPEYVLDLKDFHGKPFWYEFWKQPNEYSIIGFDPASNATAIASSLFQLNWHQNVQQQKYINWLQTLMNLYLEVNNIDSDLDICRDLWISDKDLFSLSMIQKTYENYIYRKLTF